MAATLVNTETINTAPMQPHCVCVCVCVHFVSVCFHVSDRDQRRATGKDEPMFVCTWLFLRPLTLAFQSHTHIFSLFHTHIHTHTNIHVDIS